MSAEEREEILHLVKQFKKLMKNINVPFFMYGGTLIGSYRHHGFIPWDDDIDFFIPNKHRSKLGKKPFPMPDAFLDDLNNMPDAAGIALGVDRLIMLFCNAESIDQVVSFASEIV